MTAADGPGMECVLSVDSKKRLRESTPVVGKTLCGKDNSGMGSIYKLRESNPETRKTFCQNWPVFSDTKKRLRESTPLGKKLSEIWNSLEFSKVKGSIRANKAAWEEVTDDEFLLSVIGSGYKPKLDSVPSYACKGNNNTAKAHADFVQTSVAELLVNGFAVLSESKPFVVNPITVSVQASGKKRLIADLRHLNKFLKPPKFKMEDLRVAMPALSQSEYLTTFDVAKGFYHIDLQESVWKYFGFEFEIDGQVYYATYTICPFGLATIPWLFSKLIRVWERRWWSLGMFIYIFLDNGVCRTKTEAEGEENAEIIRADLKRAGIHEQTIKCHWKPKPCLKWLGFWVDLGKKVLRIPEDKVKRMLEFIEFCLDSGKLSPKQILQAAGLVCSLAIVLGPVAYVETKPLYWEVESRGKIRTKYVWDRKFRLSDEAMKALATLHSLVSGSTKEVSMKSKEPTVVIYSDASSSGGASFIQTEKTEQMASNWFVSNMHEALAWAKMSKLSASDEIAVQSWNKLERNQSSTWRELKVIEEGLKAFVPKLQSKSVLWYTDNLGGTSVVKRGSMKQVLNPIARQITEVCRSNNIQLSVKWICRTENTVADALSRFIDMDDWAISDQLFQILDERWGPHTVDRFATNLNTKLCRFNSRFAAPNCERVDVFSVSWAQENNWIVAPPSKVPKAIVHLCDSGTEGTFVLPKWRSAAF